MSTLPGLVLPYTRRQPEEGFGSIDWLKAFGLDLLRQQQDIGIHGEDERVEDTSGPVEKLQELFTAPKRYLFDYPTTPLAIALEQDPIQKEGLFRNYQNRRPINFSEELNEFNREFRPPDESFVHGAARGLSNIGSSLVSDPSVPFAMGSPKLFRALAGIGAAKNLPNVLEAEDAGQLGSALVETSVPAYVAGRGLPSKIKEVMDPNLIRRSGKPSGPTTRIVNREPIVDDPIIPPEIQVQLDKNPAFFEKLDEPVSIKPSIADENLELANTTRIRPAPSETLNPPPTQRGSVNIGKTYREAIQKMSDEELATAKDLADDEYYRLKEDKNTDYSGEDWKISEYEKKIIDKEYGARKAQKEQLRQEDLRNASLPVRQGDAPPNIEVNQPPVDLAIRLQNVAGDEISVQTNNLSNWDRAVKPFVSNLEKANVGLGKRAKTYVYDSERAASRAMGKKKEILDSAKLSKVEEQQVISILDGTIVPNASPKVAQVSTALRGILDEFAHYADQLGVLKGYRPNYFPHKIDTGKWANDIFTPQQSRSASGIDPNLELGREANNPQWIKKLDVLDDYFIHASRRISEAKNFGKNPWKFFDTLQFSDKNKPNTARETAEYLSRNFERLTGRERSTQFSRVSKTARYAQAASDLGLAVVYQPAQAAQLASSIGMGRAAKGFVNTLRNYKQSKTDAVRSGSTFANSAFETGRALGGEGRNLYGIGSVDRFMRVVSDTSATVLIKEAMGGNKGALKDLKRLGFSNPTLAPKYRDAVAKRLSDKVNFRTTNLDMPGWTESAYGKLATQYLSFGYQAGRFFNDITTKAFKKGDVVPLARFLVASQIVGEGINDVRSAIKEAGKEDPDFEKAFKGTDEKGWIQILRNKRSSEPFKRALQNFMMTGGLGIATIALEKSIDIAEGKVGKEAALGLPLGPVGENLARGAGSVGKTVSNITRNTTGRDIKGQKQPKVNKPFKPLIEWALDQIPIYGGDIKRRVYPPRSGGGDSDNGGLSIR